MTKAYPKGTFKALLVIAVHWGEYLQKPQDALLIVEVGHLFKRLLNQLTKSLGLERRGMGGGRGTCQKVSNGCMKN